MKLAVSQADGWRDGGGVGGAAWTSGSSFSQAQKILTLHVAHVSRAILATRWLMVSLTQKEKKKETRESAEEELCESPPCLEATCV